MVLDGLCPNSADTFEDQRLEKHSGSKDAVFEVRVGYGCDAVEVYFNILQSLHVAQVCCKQLPRKWYIIVIFPQFDLDIDSF